MVIRTTRTHMTDRTDKSERRERTDRSNIKLDLPGNLCRAAFAILAMFLLYAPPQNTKDFFKIVQ